MTSTDWISLASAVVALCALGVSIWQGYVTSRHNRLSARPFLKVDMHAKDDGVSCSIINVGLGPAHLDELEFGVGDREFDFFSESFMRFVDLFRAPVEGDQEFYVHRVPPGTLIATGEAFLVFETIARPLTAEHLESVNAILPLTRCRMAYRSMYGEKFG